MADAGVGEAALLAAAAEASAATAATAGTVAATLPEVVAAAAPVVAGTAAETAATAVPALALAAPEAAALTVPTAAEAAATVAPTVAATTTEAAPITLLATESEPLSGGLLASSTTPTVATEAPATTGLLGVTPEPIGPPTAEGVWGGAPEAVTGTEQFGPSTPGLLDKLGNWWETSSLGDKLSVGGKALGGISSASKVLAPTAGSSAGPKTTIKPGSTGQPRGGEQALAQVVEALLKRRDAYSGAPYGTPVAYRPRGLLG